MIPWSQLFERQKKPIREDKELTKNINKIIKKITHDQTFGNIKIKFRTKFSR